MLTDYRIAPADGGKPKRVVILLHGLGDSGSGGLLSIGQMWREVLPDCEFICPDAPFPYDMAPPDFGGRQWFSLQSFTLDRILDGVQKAVPILDKYIDHVLETRGLTPDRLALLGFSQGSTMALYTAAWRNAPIACVAGYSGQLAGHDALRAGKKSAPPVLLVHGTDDEVIPFAMMAEAEKELKEAGIPVTTLTCPHTGHTIDNFGIAAGLKFLQRHLKS